MLLYLFYLSMLILVEILWPLAAVTGGKHTVLLLALACLNYPVARWLAKNTKGPFP